MKPFRALPQTIPKELHISLHENAAITYASLQHTPPLPAYAATRKRMFSTGLRFFVLGRFRV